MTKWEAYKPKILLTFSMVVFGTVGIVRKYIPLPSGAVAMVRAFIGALFLIAVMLVLKVKPERAAIKKNLLKLIVSGMCMGANWVLLFESFNYTTVASATLCYYMAPVFLIVISPFLFKEKISLRNGICILLAVLGVLMVSGVFEGSLSGGNLSGIILALGAAVLYTCVMAISKSVEGIEPHLKTVIQLLSALAVILVYSLIFESVDVKTLTPTVIALLLVLGVLHTGITYTFYFGYMEKVSAQTLAVMSYIDPVVAVILSAVLLKEPITVFGIIGAVLIIGSAAALE